MAEFHADDVQIFVRELAKNGGIFAGISGLMAEKRGNLAYFSRKCAENGRITRVKCAENGAEMVENARRIAASRKYVKNGRNCAEI